MTRWGDAPCVARTRATESKGGWGREYARVEHQPLAEALKTSPRSARRQ